MDPQQFVHILWGGSTDPQQFVHILWGGASDPQQFVHILGGGVGRSFRRAPPPGSKVRMIQRNTSTRGRLFQAKCECKANASTDHAPRGTRECGPSCGPSQLCQNKVNAISKREYSSQPKLQQPTTIGPGHKNPDSNCLSRCRARSPSGPALAPCASPWCCIPVSPHVSKIKHRAGIGELCTT